MKKIFTHLVTVLILVLFAVKVNAQCGDFRVSVRPASPMLCPGGTDTLTTQLCDSYQWFKNNVAIAGATNRALVISYDKDKGALFKVAGIKGACKDTSKNVQANFYVFPPPSIIISGDSGVYNATNDSYTLCPGDTMVLTLDTPYTTRIKWKNNGTALPGGHSQSYNVTNKGAYTVCGAVPACPKYIPCVATPVNVVFKKPVATITERNDTLFASKGQKFQWYSSNVKIIGATKSWYVPTGPGAFKVAIVDATKCRAVSETYYFTPGLAPLVTVAPNPVKDVLRLNINAAGAKQVVIVDLYGNQKLKTAVTGNSQSISVQNLHAGTYVVRVLNSKSVQVASATIVKQ